jgi:hypothetical protein
MATTPQSEHLTSAEFTERTMLADLTQQPWLIAAGVGIGAVVLFNMLRRQPEQERAARRLVRDWRKVDDVDDVRDLLGDNLPTIVRPVLLMVLQQVERQVQTGFRRLERSIHHL